MKNILVLSDFSANARHAAQAAIMIAKHLHANILLFNAAMAKPAYAGGPTFAEEVIFIEQDCDKLKDIARQIEDSLEKDEKNWKPSVHYEVRLSSLSSGIKSVSAEKTIEMIVMGAREGSSMDHFLAGSDTFSVIDHADRPVLVIPYGVDINDLKKVVFATNFAAHDMSAINYLLKLRSTFKFHLEIVHIDLSDGNDLTREFRKIEFMNDLHRPNDPAIIIEEIFGKDIVNRLSSFCNESNTDMLAFTHYNDSFFSKIFHRSTSRKALETQTVPMLIFPSAFES
jgi:nucleotide-binding universal stress UspA family protein